MAESINSEYANGSGLKGNEVEQNWEEVEIPVPWGIVAGKWWGSRTQQPILAIHGWQDNAGTFDRLIPLLPAHLSVLCIDLPGHGKSSHYPVGMQYYLFWDGISLIRRIVKHFNWDKITLMGHSLGGALSFMYSAAFPDDVHRLISIDIAGPTVRDTQRTASKIGESIDRLLKYETLPVSKIPCYNYNEMIDLVLDAYAGSVDRASAEILMRRGMAVAPPELLADKKITGACFHFARDLRLKVSSLGMFSLDQVLAYAVQIRCEVLNIRGRPGMSFDSESTYDQVIEAMRSNTKRVVYEQVDGTHHLHLNTPERVAPVIAKFLAE